MPTIICKVLKIEKSEKRAYLIVRDNEANVFSFQVRGEFLRDLITLSLGQIISASFRSEYIEKHKINSLILSGLKQI